MFINLQWGNIRRGTRSVFALMCGCLPSRKRRRNLEQKRAALTNAGSWYRSTKNKGAPPCGPHAPVGPGDIELEGRGGGGKAPSRWGGGSAPRPAAAAVAPLAAAQTLTPIAESSPGCMDSSSRASTR